MAGILVSTQEATDLLQKWLSENRVIHLTLNTSDDASGPMARVVGRIDSIENNKVIFSGKKSAYSLGRHNLCHFPLEACTFEYSDAKDSPEPLRSTLLGYDGVLYIFYVVESPVAIRSAIALAVLPVEEYTEF